MNNLDYKGVLIRKGDYDAEWIFPCDVGCSHGLWLYLDNKYAILEIGISVGRPISLWERIKSIFKILIGIVYVPDAIDLNIKEVNQLKQILDTFEKDVVNND